MELRDIVVTIVVFGAIPFILRRPYLGVLVWSWISYMNPHRLGWGFAREFPFAQVTAITLVISLLFDREPKRVPVDTLVVLWVIFILWISMTTLFAVYPDQAMPQLIKAYKIHLAIFLTLLLINDREKINQLLWVIALSIGFFGIKGGIFTIMHGGSARVWGPDGSFIRGNNELALALLMVIPLFFYLRSQLTNRWLRHAMIMAMLLMALSAAGSQSRGALLAGLAVAGFFWLKSQHKFIGLLAAIPLLVGIFIFMPETWHERMATIFTYQEDASAMGRVNAWMMAFHLANDNIMGWGFNFWGPEAYLAYYPAGYSGLVAHSIYFSVLGEHGWIGLMIFLAVLACGWMNLRWVLRHTKGHEDLQWAQLLARMIQVSFIAYCSGGMFLSLSYYDLPWQLLIITSLLRDMIKQKLTTNAYGLAGTRFAQSGRLNTGGQTPRDTAN